MKRLLLLLILCLPAFAAIPATMVWEVESGATALNVNGCGFDSASVGTGTDWSQQSAAHVHIDNSAVIATANAAVVTFTSGYTVATTDVGNVVHILTGGAGLTPDWFHIQSVNTGSGTWTLDHTTGMSGTAITSAYMGGACSLNSTIDDAFFEKGIAGNIFYIKSGSYNLGGTVAISAAGGTQNPIRVLGYNATRGDNPTDSTRPLINTTSSFAFTYGANWDSSYMRYTTTAAAGITVGLSGKVTRSQFTNTSTTASRVAVTLSSNGVLSSSEAVSYRGTGVNLSATGTIIGSYIHDSPTCINVSGVTNSAVLTDNILLYCPTAAINIASANTSSETFINNTIYGAPTPIGNGINITSGTTNLHLMNNIISGFTTGVNHADVQSVGFDRYNFFYNNTTDTTNWAFGTGSTTGTNPQFTLVSSVTTATATTSNTGNTLVQTGATFVSSGVTAGRDYVNITSTSGTAGIYGIVSVDSETQITLDLAPGASSGNVVATIITGRNMAIGTNLKAAAFPGAFPGALTTGYLDPGAVQRQEPSSTVSAGASLTCIQ